MKFFVLLILTALYVEIHARRLCRMMRKRYQCQSDGSCVMVRLCWPQSNSYITYDLCVSKCGKKSGACTTCALCAQTPEITTLCTDYCEKKIETIAPRTTP
ncbi:unnamed protein product [Cylicocyclus nassatus]|uniref:Uncharacterized protein n=1 Tax=Cylicocyclus nassatus TaxID=53992 RepID=A0AA36DKW8_CYLNA|nr:unnamed protein product [Cylicocyclus nassatus]